MTACPEPVLARYLDKLAGIMPVSATDPRLYQPDSSVVLKPLAQNERSRLETLVQGERGKLERLEDTRVQLIRQAIASGKITSPKPSVPLKTFAHPSDSGRRFFFELKIAEDGSVSIHSVGKVHDDRSFRPATNVWQCKSSAKVRPRINPEAPYNQFTLPFADHMSARKSNRRSNLQYYFYNDLQTTAAGYVSRRNATGFQLIGSLPSATSSQIVNNLDTGAVLENFAMIALDDKRLSKAIEAMDQNPNLAHDLLLSHTSEGKTSFYLLRPISCFIPELKEEDQFALPARISLPQAQLQDSVLARESQTIVKRLGQVRNSDPATINEVVDNYLSQCLGFDDVHDLQNYIRSIAVCAYSSDTLDQAIAAMRQNLGPCLYSGDLSGGSYNNPIAAALHNRVYELLAQGFIYDRDFYDSHDFFDICFPQKPETKQKKTVQEGQRKPMVDFNVQLEKLLQERGHIFNTRPELGRVVARSITSARTRLDKLCASFKGKSFASHLLLDPAWHGVCEQVVRKLEIIRTSTENKLRDRGDFETQIAELEQILSIMQSPTFQETKLAKITRLEAGQYPILVESALGPIGLKTHPGPNSQEQIVELNLPNLADGKFISEAEKRTVLNLISKFAEANFEETGGDLTLIISLANKEQATNPGLGELIKTLQETASFKYIFTSEQVDDANESYGNLVENMTGLSLYNEFKDCNSAEAFETVAHRIYQSEGQQLADNLIKIADLIPERRGVIESWADAVASARKTENFRYQFRDFCGMVHNALEHNLLAGDLGSWRLGVLELYAELYLKKEYAKAPRLAHRMFRYLLCEYFKIAQLSKMLDFTIDPDLEQGMQELVQRTLEDKASFRTLNEFDSQSQILEFYEKLVSYHDGICAQAFGLDNSSINEADGGKALIKGMEAPWFTGDRRSTLGTSTNLATKTTMHWTAQCQNLKKAVEGSSPNSKFAQVYELDHDQAIAVESIADIKDKKFMHKELGAVRLCDECSKVKKAKFDQIGENDYRVRLD